jgi:hypothetical protein
VLVAGAAGLTAGDGSMAAWVGPLVYGGFTWQAVFLLVAFVLYARDRWTWTGRPDALPVPARSLVRALAGGGAVVAVVSAALHLTAGLTAPVWTVLLTQGTDAVLALLGAVGVVALVRRSTSRVAVVGGWAGSGGAFTWGLYHCLLTLGGTPLAGSDPLANLAALTGLLGGFALAAGGLLALAGGQRET